LKEKKKERLKSKFVFSLRFGFIFIKEIVKRTHFKPELECAGFKFLERNYYYEKESTWFSMPSFEVPIPLNGFPKYHFIILD
jgi:hypothetical protein